MLKNNWTKWIPIGVYTHGGDEFVVMGRRNTKTGMLRFRSVRVNPRTFGPAKPILPLDVEDVQKNWNELTGKELGVSL